MPPVVALTASTMALMPSGSFSSESPWSPTDCPAAVRLITGNTIVTAFPVTPSVLAGIWLAANVGPVPKPWVPLPPPLRASTAPTAPATTAMTATSATTWSHLPRSLSCRHVRRTRTPKLGISAPLCWWVHRTTASQRLGAGAEVRRQGGRVRADLLSGTVHDHPARFHHHHP